MAHWTDELVRIGVCQEAVDWHKPFPTYAQGWHALHRGDWSLWLVAKYDKSAPWSGERKPVVRAALACAALAKPWMNETLLALLALGESWVAGVKLSDDDRAAVEYTARHYDPRNTTVLLGATVAVTAAVASIVVIDRAFEAAIGAASAAACAGGLVPDVSHAGARVPVAHPDGMAMLSRCADIINGYFPKPPGT